ncbi:MAG TPA: thioredoxin domain-containing protein [Terriglobales bacterium]|jgi:protein-disulfide isomerase|nr:thioredoxin domain-containing protein [Terriglobales bacterium]
MHDRAVFLSLLSLLGVAAVSALARDMRALHPPQGARVAIVVFEDLQCPDCARANPLLEEAARTYKIPLVRYDFPLPMHNWSFQAAVLARYFDTKSQKLGDEFRDALFTHQPEITPDSLRAFAEKFAQEHKMTLPFVIDPKGELERKVRADYQLGQATGIQHTPTIYVVSNSTTGEPFVEVVDRTQLYRMIDDMLQQAGPATPKKQTAKKQ